MSHLSTFRCVFGRPPSMRWAAPVGVTYGSTLSSNPALSQSVVAIGLSIMLLVFACLSLVAFLDATRQLRRNPNRAGTGFDRSFSGPIPVLRQTGDTSLGRGDADTSLSTKCWRRSPR